MVSFTDLVRESEPERPVYSAAVANVGVCESGYLDTIRNAKPANSRWKILVVDAFTKQHLNHVLKVYDILEEGVQRECRWCRKQRGKQASANTKKSQQSDPLQWHSIDLLSCGSLTINSRMVLSCFTGIFELSALPSIQFSYESYETDYNTNFGYTFITRRN